MLYIENVQRHNTRVAGKDQMLGGVAPTSRMLSCKSHVEFRLKKVLTKAGTQPIRYAFDHGRFFSLEYFPMLDKAEVLKYNKRFLTAYRLA